VGLDRRLLINEKISEDCLDRIKLSQSALESYFQSSTDIKRFQKSADTVQHLQQIVSSLQVDMTQMNSIIYKLDANACMKNDHIELRERVSHLEPMVIMTSTEILYHHHHHHYRHHYHQST
jgi:hypothetical protein